eukprot:Rhum_TRINITY_DN14478_c0_g1::Rhum_TRINITY_DN14478_c0_g1_i1::g.90293::m.90293
MESYVVCSQLCRYLLQARDLGPHIRERALAEGGLEIGRVVGSLRLVDEAGERKRPQAGKVAEADVVVLERDLLGVLRVVRGRAPQHRQVNVQEVRKVARRLPLHVVRRAHDPRRHQLLVLRRHPAARSPVLGCEHAPQVGRALLVQGVLRCRVVHSVVEEDGVRDKVRARELRTVRVEEPEHLVKMTQVVVVTPASGVAVPELPPPVRRPRRRVRRRRKEAGKPLRQAVSAQRLERDVDPAEQPPPRLVHRRKQRRLVLVAREQQVRRADPLGAGQLRRDALLRLLRRQTVALHQPLLRDRGRHDHRPHLVADVLPPRLLEDGRLHHQHPLPALRDLRPDPVGDDRPHDVRQLLHVALVAGAEHAAAQRLPVDGPILGCRRREELADPAVGVGAGVVRPVAQHIRVEHLDVLRLLLLEVLAHRRLA